MNLIVVWYCEVHSDQCTIYCYEEMQNAYMYCATCGITLFCCVYCMLTGQDSSEQSLLREYMTSWKGSESPFKPFRYRMFNQYLLH